MARKKFTEQQVKEGLKSIELMIKAPFSKEADEELDRVVADYNSGAYDLWPQLT